MSAHLHQSLAMVACLFKRACYLLPLFMASMAAAQPQTEPGTLIENTANASWQQAGETRSAQSNTVQTTTTIFSSQAEIEFLRIAPSSGGYPPAGDVKTTQCQSPNGQWNDMPPPKGSNGAAISDSANLNSADAYVMGEPVYFEVADADQNRDIEAIDSVVVTISSDTGDSETLTIFETGNNTGVFVGYVQSAETNGTPITNDCVLSVKRNGELNLSYTDRFDSSETMVDVALVDPYGIVFDSKSGDPVDGVTVTLINANTGQPATVYADDGVSAWPSTVVTGDSSLGLGAGEFRFPLVDAGDYFLQIEPSDAYVFPSGVPDAQMPTNSSTGQPYVVVTGSRGEVFSVPFGPPVQVDVPIDPILQELVIEKSAQRNVVQQGDFLQYTLQLSNLSTRLDANNIYVYDVLPLGFRYQAGSTQIDGNRALDPVIAPNGRDLTFEVGNLAQGASRSLKYVVRISAGAAEGQALNQANATADGGLISNLAEAAVTVEAAFQQGTMTLVGRVMDTDCTPSDRPARSVAGVRVYLENGRYAVTDNEGKYRFEGVSARPHVVQLDQASLPVKYEPNFCYDDSRYAGTPFSRFVDAQSGSLWRADFYVKPKEPLQSTVSIRLQSEVERDTINYRISYQVNEVGTHSNEISVMLPEGVEPVVDSATVDGQTVRLRNQKGVVTIDLNKSGAPFNSELRLQAKLTPQACDAGVLETKAIANFSTLLRKRNRTPAVSNRLSCLAATAAAETYVYRPQFLTLDAHLMPADVSALASLADTLANRPIERIEVRGHTDGDAIRARSQHLYANNQALSLARAQSVAEYLASQLGVAADRIQVQGLGAKEPLVANTSAANKAKNRRVEVKVYSQGQAASGALAALVNDSGFKGVTVEGPGWTAPIQWQPALINQPKWADYNRFWLNEQNAKPEIVLPTKDYNPAGVSIPIAVKHAPELTAKVYLNGVMVSPLNYEGRDANADRSVVLSRWVGVDIPVGDNDLDVRFFNKAGEHVSSLQRTVRRSSSPIYAELIEARSRLIADGQQPPVIAVRLTDKTGAPIGRGSTGQFDIASGQQTLERVQDDTRQGVRNAQPELFRYQVEDDSGTAFIRLSPTTDAGRVDLRFNFSERREQQLTAWLTEPARDWILVGLAEGTLAERLPKGAIKTSDDDDVYSDGRVALFAKGRVLGSALLTLRYDSSKTESRQFGHNGDIDPDAWYTLYGDEAFTGQDGSSQNQLYVRLERGNFHATYGDIETDFDVLELADYQRSLTGLKSELRGQYVSYNLFAAEADSGLLRDQIRADGTSGFYRLSQLPKLNTENVTIETRHRLRSQEIVSSRRLSRYSDYQINYRDGTLFFRQPIPARDEALNPVYIVVNYEVEQGGDKTTTAGARVALHNASRSLLFGSSYLYEDDVSQRRSLIAADGRVRIGQFTELRAEFGQTRLDAAGVSESASGKVLEVIHQGPVVNGSIYFREIEAGYGMGTVAGSESGTRKVGVQGEVKLTQNFSITADAADEENLSDGNQRRYAQAGMRFSHKSGHIELGYRRAEDETAGGVVSQSKQMIVDARQTFFSNLLAMSARYEKSLAETDAAADFPDRVVLGLDVRVAPSTLLYVAQEYSEGSQRKTRSTKLGVQTHLWQGAELNSYIAQQTGVDGQAQLVSGNGFSQQFAFDSGWWAQLGFDQAATLRGSNGGALNDDTPLISAPDGDDYQSAYAGFGRKTTVWHWDMRYETHRSENSRRDAVISSWQRNLLDGVSYDAALRWLDDESDSAHNRRLEAQLGWAYRPAEAEWFFLNRLDLIHEDQQAADSQLKSARIINQLNANWLPQPEDQLSLFVGVKYLRDTIDQQVYSGLYSQLGVEYRHSINTWWDWGLQLSSYNDWQANNMRYSAGLSVGVSPLQNLWVSVGYNWAGFEDSDFDEAAWTGSGAFVRFRLKFDQVNGLRPKRHGGMQQSVDGEE